MAKIATKKGKTIAEREPATDLTLEEKIRRLAYKLYEERGCEDGDDMRDWLQAERLVSNSPVISSVSCGEASPARSRSRRIANKTA